MIDMIKERLHFSTLDIILLAIFFIIIIIPIAINLLVKISKKKIVINTTPVEPVIHKEPEYPNTIGKEFYPLSSTACSSAYRNYISHEEYCKMLKNKGGQL